MAISYSDVPEGQAEPPPLRPLGLIHLLLWPLLFALASGERRDHLIRRRNYTRHLARRKRAVRQVKSLLSKEARQYEKILINTWTRRGENHIDKANRESVDPDGKPRKLKKRRVKRVRFERIFAQEDVISFKIKIRKRFLFTYKNVLPFRVDAGDLISPDALLELSAACERVVTAKFDNPRRGVWVQVWRGSGVGGLPVKLDFRSVLENYNASDPAPLMIGAFGYRGGYTQSLTKVHHILIGGATGSGKSNILNNIICGLIRFVPADELQLILIDRKLLEFSLYTEVPHLAGPVISDIDETITTLQQIEKELRRRTQVMAGQAKELHVWNRLHPDQKMPRLVVIMDEFADFSLIPDHRKAAAIIDLVTQIQNLGRAVGIHTIVCTQRPDRRVVPGSLKINMGMIIAGRTPNPVQSAVILGSGEAAALPDIPGRMIVQVGSRKTVVQTPLITEEDIAECVAISKGRAAGVIRLEGLDSVIIRDGLLRHIADSLGGSLAFSVLAEQLAPLGISRTQLKHFLSDVKPGEEIIVENRVYEVQRKGNSYRLVLVATLETEAEPAAASEPSTEVLLLSASAGQEPEPLDDFECFVAACCTLADPKAETTAKELYTAYLAWCEGKYPIPRSAKSFGLALGQLGLRRRKTKGSNSWIGIALVTVEIAASAA